jgi:hypothetical protein
MRESVSHQIRRTRLWLSFSQTAVPTLVVEQDAITDIYQQPERQSQFQHFHHLLRHYVDAHRTSLPVDASSHWLSFIDDDDTIAAGRMKTFERLIVEARSVGQFAKQSESGHLFIREVVAILEDGEPREFVHYAVTVRLFHYFLEHCRPLHYHRLTDQLFFGFLRLEQCPGRRLFTALDAEDNKYRYVRRERNLDVNECVFRYIALFRKREGLLEWMRRLANFSEIEWIVESTQEYMAEVIKAILAAPLLSDYIQMSQILSIRSEIELDPSERLAYELRETSENQSNKRGYTTNRDQSVAIVAVERDRRNNNTTNNTNQQSVANAITLV